MAEIEKVYFLDKATQMAIKQGVDEINIKSDQIKQNTETIKTTTNATKTVVDDVNTNLAIAKTDVAFIKTTTNTINTNVNTVNSNLGTPTSSASNSTSGNTHSKLNWLLVNSGRVVKSIQRGTTLMPQGGNSVTINFSSVDISKCSVDFKGTEVIYVSNFTSTSMKLSVSNDGTMYAATYLSWEVTEYY